MRREDIVLLYVKETSQDVTPFGHEGSEDLEKRPALLDFVGEEESEHVVVGGIVGTKEDGECLVWTLACKSHGDPISGEIKCVDAGGNEASSGLEILV
jgi:hypothetical protein